MIKMDMIWALVFAGAATAGVATAGHAAATSTVPMM
jgi:hypothetical protein